MTRKGKIALAAISIFLGGAGWTGLQALLHSPGGGGNGAQEMEKKVKKSDQEWKVTLSPEQYKIMIQCGTEPPFSGKYNDFYEKGTYYCAACGAPLFDSNTKYDHGTGWPSFTSPISGPAVEYHDDFSLMTHRIEVRCRTCGAHLGHVFDDGPGPSRKHYCINSAAMNFVPFKAQEKAPVASPGVQTDSKTTQAQPIETATFAAGCFWGVEYKFGQVPGVLDTVVGYTGGVTKNPTYRDVCTDSTGHAEAIQVTYDPSKVSYEELVRKFFAFHDPTQLNRQGPDVGTQYRSMIFTNSPDQTAIAERVKDEVNRSGKFRQHVVTDIVPLGDFTKAEEYHQKYYEKNKIKSCGY